MGAGLKQMPISPGLVSELDLTFEGRGHEVVPGHGRGERPSIPGERRPGCCRMARALARPLRMAYGMGSPLRPSPTERGRRS
jgi:hypothetical protein